MEQKHGMSFKIRQILHVFLFADHEVVFAQNKKDIE